MGLNALMSTQALDPRAAAKGTQNILYEYGILRTPQGFTKVDLTTTGLNSGDIVLCVFQWKELDEYGHVMAVTTEKIYEHDRVNSRWDDKSQSGVTYNSAIDHPISYAVVGHDDTAIYLDDDSSRSNAYHHVVVCDGGLSNIQRWAGRYEDDFADLVGAGGYHDGTTHRALQVSQSAPNRLILLSPQTYSSSSKVWTENNQTVRWPVIRKIETWTGTGSGAANLYETAGANVWSAPLGADHIIYQTQGIWSLKYVGGKMVFDPRPVESHLGLLSYHLLCWKRNIHYFVGTDYNIYSYYGGSLIKPIGDAIHKYLQDELDPTYNARCWMLIGPEHKRLWLFIVPSGSTYITKAYCMNMLTNAWTIRDFASKYSSAEGITAVTLAGAESYTSGDSYSEALDTLSPYDANDGTGTAADLTIRYGDKLLDTSRTLAFDPTNASFCAGGLRFDGSVGANYKADFTINDIMVIEDGSIYTTDGTYTNQFGTHFYAIEDVSTDKAWVRAWDDSIGACITADITVDDTLSFGLYNPNGDTYNEVVEVRELKERILLGDATGMIFQVDETYTQDDSNLIACRHVTGEFDWGLPDTMKRWPGLSVVAEGSDDGAMYVGYRISDFDTSDTGWTDVSFDLTSNYEEKTFWINKSSTNIQFAMKDFSGKAFSVRSYKVLEPLVEENR
ncbi:MAG: hypothetical protein AMJ75_00260 [Phycisphaerae bacterium SM1_79]|nr:MAG: hypothetical protein AMJ75_00260 [Phycisphaerae bacterium SM1_79]